MRLLCSLGSPATPAAIPHGLAQSQVASVTAKTNESHLIVAAALSAIGVNVWEHPSGSIVAIDGEVFDSNRVTNGLPCLADLYEKMSRDGLGYLASLNASATVIFWDARKQELFAARDRYGKAHVFYAQIGGRIVVSSDLPSILACGAVPELDLQSVDCFLARGYVPAPLTFIKSIRKLGPGEYLRARPGELTIGTYFKPSARPHLNLSRSNRIREIRERLTLAVSRRIAPTGPTAVLLSAGVDSSLVLGTLVRECAARAEAFTFHYRDYEGPYNESEAARALAGELGVRHHAIDCGPSDLVASLPEVTRSYGEPLTYGLHSFMMQALKRTGMSVTLTGVGADGFGISDSGFASVAFQQMARPIRSLTRTTLTGLASLSPRLKSKAYALLWSEAHHLPSCLHPALTRDEDRLALYADKTWAECANRQTLDILHNIASGFEGEPAISQWRFSGQRCFTAEGALFWNTIWSHAHNLQLRHPFLDNDVQELVMRMGWAGRGKSYVREVAAEMLPYWVATAPKIHQTIPIGHWFRGPLRDFLESGLKEASHGDLFDPATIDRLKQEHLSGVADHTWRLWAILSISVWRKEVFSQLARTSDLRSEVANDATSRNRIPAVN